MTKLERARAHLLERQYCLAVIRKAAAPWPDSDAYRQAVHRHSEALLAALSWVWESQEATAIEQRNNRRDS